MATADIFSTVISQSDTGTVPCVDLRVAYFGGGSNEVEQLDEGYPVVKHALDVAIQDSLVTPCDGKMPYRIINVTACNDVDAPAMYAEAYFKHGANVAFGPGCSSGMIPVAKMAAFYDMPILTAKAARSELEDKSLFTTLIRLSETMNVQVQATVAILKRYDWKTVSVLATTPLSKSTFEAHARVRGADVSLRHFWTDASDSEAIAAFQTMMADDARIIIIHNYMRSTELMRTIAKLANNAGFITADRVFILCSIFYAREPGQADGPTFFRNLADSQNDAAVMALLKRSIVIEPTTANQQINDEFAKEMLLATGRADIYNKNLSEASGGSITLLYDTVALYARAVNACLKKLRCNYTSGADIALATHCIAFDGKSGEVVINDIAEREGSAIVWGETKTGFGITGELNQVNVCSDTMALEYTETTPQFWPNGRVPKDEPSCGFESEYCHEDHTRVALVLGIAAGVLALMSVAAYCYISHLRMQKRLYEDVWRIDSNELAQYDRVSGQSTPTVAATSTESLAAGPKLTQATIHDTPYRYRGQTVFVASYRRNVPHVLSFKLNERRRLTQIRALNHDNLATFYGMTLDAKPELMTVWQHCQRGRLLDILTLDDLDLDEVFVSSMLKDMARGLYYIHSSPVQVHGAVNTNNVHVDKRWTLKFVGTGMDVLGRHKAEGNLADDLDFYDLLHRPPEELREIEAGRLSCSQAGDIYAAAMVAYQIVWKDLIFKEIDLSYEEMIRKIIDGKDRVDQPKLRPSLKTTARATAPELAARLCNLLTDCWSEKPGDRPFAKTFNSRTEAIVGKTSRDLMDHLMTLMEKYTTNLERIVLERTKKVEEEKQRADFLLYQLLPKSIADKLMSGVPVEPHEYSSATVFFSDIVKFTALCALSTPMQVVSTLNAVFITMDTILERHDVYKVETIGDAYMVVSGIPKDNGEHHCTEIADMALELRKEISEVEFAVHAPKKNIEMRFGINTGPVAAGIIGHTMPRYCLFGDTVNVASRLESTGEPMKIQISTSTKDILSRDVRYSISFRGQVELKGKGKQSTYWLNGYESVVAATTAGYTKPPHSSSTSTK